MKSKILSSSLLIAGFLLGASALSAVAAWTAPSVPNPGETGCNPPNCNTAAPLHVGSVLQTKTGPLQLNWLTNGFAAIGLQLNGKIQINDAGADVNTVGSVLTNEGSGVGTWKAIGSSVSGMKSFTSSGSWSVPAGAKFAKVTAVGAGGYIAGGVAGGGGLSVTGYDADVAFKVVPLTGISSISVTVGSVNGSAGWGSHPGGDTSVTAGSYTIVASGGSSVNATQGADFSVKAPYLGYGDGPTSFSQNNPPYPGYNPTGGFVIIEYY